MAWHSGEAVMIRAAEWLVAGSTPYVDCEGLDVVHARTGAPRTFLLPFDRVIAQSAAPPRYVSRRRWAREVADRLRATFPFGGLRFCPPGIRLLPYQLEPALATLRHGALRILLADDVGLGKTVEAGMVLREVIHGDRLARALVVCPANLKAQWVLELAALFEIEARQADAAWLHRAAGEMPADVNPWSIPGTYVASTDFVKRPEALKPLEDVQWDLLVVDEAHTCTPGTDRLAAIRALAARSLRVLLLTATPHSGNDAQFARLCELGGGAEPLVCFSRSRDDAGLGAPPVRSLLLPVRLTTAEERTHRLLEAYTERMWLTPAPGRRPGTELVAMVLRKRALSSAGALARSARRRLALLAEGPALPAQLELPLGLDDEADLEPASVLGTPCLDDTDEERARLLAIAEAADRAAADESKMRVLIRLLRRACRPAIVFSEFRDTAQAIAASLGERGYPTLLLHGGLLEEERRDVVAAFAAGGRILVATDAASEGLNLQQACRLVVHYELPWTPSRLHQRCGRVNRIGQSGRVHEIALVGRDTAEQFVLAPLLRRAARSGSLARGNLVAQLTESAVAVHVFEGTALPDRQGDGLVPDQVRTLDLRAEAEQEVGRLTLVRRLDALSRGRSGGAPRRKTGVAVARRLQARFPPPSHLLCLFKVSLRDGRGGCLEEEVLPLLVRCGEGEGPRATRPIVLPRQAAGVVAHVTSWIPPLLERRLSERLERIRPLHEAVLQALRQRAAARRASAARELVQAGLFDRRALRARDERARAHEMLLEEDTARVGPASYGDDRRVQVHADFQLIALALGRA